MKERTELAQFIRSGCDDLFRKEPQLLAPYEGNKELFAAATEKEGHYNGEGILLVTAHKYRRDVSCYFTNGISEVTFLKAPSPPESLPANEIKLAHITSYHWMWLKPKSEGCSFQLCPIPEDPSVLPAAARPSRP
jgi:hypothetical protein